MRPQTPQVTDEFKPSWSARLRARPLDRCLTIADLRDLARHRVPLAVFNYVDGGAEDELTLHSNRTAFQSQRFLPRVLQQTHQASTTAKILGGRTTAPLILAPAGFTRMLHSAGEVAVAHAASSRGLIYTLSTVGTVTPEELQANVPNGRHWFQLYPTTDQSINADLISRARASGFEALVVTVDTQIGGRKLRDIRSGFTLPPRVTLNSFGEILRKPGWWMNIVSSLPLKLYIADYFEQDVGMASPRLMNLMRNQHLDIPLLETFKSQWSGPFIVKGILRPDDAKRLAEIGVDAIIVSNHGGRQLDQSIASLDALKLIKRECEIPAIVDGGIQTGRDIVIAIASGACAAQIGRSYLYGLMAGGQAGVDLALRLLIEETERTMVLLGLSSITDLSPECLVKPQTRA
jgi:L-lactate dehydrogenase (cytochrome)